MPKHPNVLFLLSDEHSHRFFSHLDPSQEGEPVRTPSFDALANSSAVFAQTYCQMPLCTPSRICLLTGRDQASASAWTNGSWLRPDLPTLPGVFAEAGYTTCLVGKMHFGGDRQFNGFQHRPYGDLTGHAGHQHDPLNPEKGRGLSGMRRRTANAGITEIPESLLQEQVVMRETIAWLREHRHRRPGTPWFVCASFSRPHFPLTAPRRCFERYWPHGVTPPKVGRSGDTVDHPMTTGMARGFQVEAIDEEEMMRARAAYFACVEYLDEVIGDLLAVLARDGLLEEAIIVYTSDHGEMAGEHGLWWKNSWHEGSSRVPWFVQMPEHRTGMLPARRFETPVSLADLFPTLCALAGLAPPETLDGMDLSEAIRDGREPVRRGPVVCDALEPRWGPGTEFRMVRHGRYKYVGFRSALPLLFDLVADPFEQKNLAVGHVPPEMATVRDRLAGFVADSVDFDVVERQREEDRARTKAHALRINPGTGNAYLMPDGRLVDADTTLYCPQVLSENPSGVFADWPDGEETRA